MKRYFFLLILFIFKSYCQNGYWDIDKMTNLSPTTSSILKFQEIPVSNFTGIPEISIPIYDIKVGELNLPINLSYHASGITANETSGSVGLGWALSTVPSITRKINGFRDESGFIQNNTIEEFQNANLETRQIIFLNYDQSPQNNFEGGQADLEADEFFLSIPGFSGKFIYSQEQDKFITYPFSNIKINAIITEPSSYSRPSIQVIEVIDGEGKVYTFGGGESVEYAKDSGFSANYDDRNGIVAWSIASISHKGGHISFFYNNEHYNKIILKNKVVRYLKYPPYSHFAYTSDAPVFPCTELNAELISNYSSFVSNYEQGIDEDPTPVVFYNLNENNLSHVIFNGGEIYFNYTNREDITGLKKLSEIIINNNQEQYIKAYSLNYSYFLANNFEDQNKKLKLDSIDDHGSQGSASSDNFLRTSFEYYQDVNLPTRYSKSIDYWGYYNNKLNTTTIPKSIYETWSTQTPHTKYTSQINLMYLPEIPLITSFSIKKNSNFKILDTSVVGNRNVNPSTISTMSLKSILYPNGHKKEFIYEPNMAERISYVSPSYESPDYYFDNDAYPDKLKIEVTNLVGGYAYTPYGTNTSQIYSTCASCTSVLENNTSHTKTYRKEINIDNINRDFDVNLDISSNFYAEHFINNLPSTFLNAAIEVYYYENSTKKTIANFQNVRDIHYTFIKGLESNKFPSSGTIYIDIIHTYLGGLSLPPSSTSIPFSTNISLKYVKHKVNDNNNFYSGGQRIKEIKLIDNNQLIYSYKYEYKKDNNTSSSGVLFSLPFYKKSVRFMATISTSGLCSVVGLDDFYSTEISGSPYINGMGISSSTTGYERVKVSYCSNYGIPNGSEVFEYNIGNSFFYADNELAFMEPSDYKYLFYEKDDWNHNKLSKHYIYDMSDNIKSMTEYFYYSGFPSYSSSDYLNLKAKSLLASVMPEHQIKSSTAFSILNWGSSLFNGSGEIKHLKGFYSNHIGYGADYVNNYLSGGYTRKLPIMTYTTGEKLLQKSKKYTYLNTDVIEEEEEYFYEKKETPTLITKKTTKTSTNDVIITKYYRANDSEVENEQNVNNMIVSNNIETPILTQNYKNSELIAEQKVIYNTTLPLYISIKKGEETANDFERKINYIYDDNNNLIQYTKENGSPVSLIWGYDKTQPIAKLENMSYSSISQSIIENLQSKSNNDNDSSFSINGSTNEQILIIALNNLRNLYPFALITTYTHDPLIGLTSVTDEKGYISYYIYDRYNRLKEVKDKDGNTLSENQYHYRP